MYRRTHASMRIVVFTMFSDDPFWLKRLLEDSHNSRSVSPNIFVLFEKVTSLHPASYLPRETVSDSSFRLRYLGPRLREIGVWAPDQLATLVADTPTSTRLRALHVSTNLSYGFI